MARSGLALTWVALAACSHPTIHHNPGEQYLAAVQIEGNHAIASDKLTPGLLVHRRLEDNYDPSRKHPASVDGYQLSTDVDRVAGAYKKLGFFSVDVRSRVEHHGDAETAVITVVEGPRAHVKVELDGLPADVPLAKARKLVDLADGAPFDYDAYDNAKAPLLRLIQDSGYAHARLDATVIADTAHQVAIARYVIDAGPSCTFGQISIVGADGALGEAVEARLAVHEGQKFSTSAVAATQTALYGMGRFSTVRVDVDRDSDSPIVAVKIGLTEGTRHEFRAGGGLGLDPINYSVRGRATYTQVGWPFALSTVGLDFRPAYTFLRESCAWYHPLDCQSDPRVRLIGTLSQQDFLLTGVRADVEAGADFLTIEAYTIEGIHSRLSLSTPLGTPRVTVRLGWLLAGNEFTDLEIDQATAHQIGVDHFERLGVFNQTLVLDLRDHPIEPRYGAYAEVHLAEGTRYAGSLYEYTQITPEVRAFAPLGPLTLAARVRIGKIYGEVPPTERYYAGGASSARGYPERQLSPVGTDIHGGEVVIGGAALVESGLELRVPLGSPKGIDLGGVAFLDGGNVTNTASELSVTQQQWAFGIGLRWFALPVGPARLDFAYRFNREDPMLSQQSRFQWFLSVGEAY